MPEQWIIQVQGKEYGPADLATLREWKADGRVLPTNPARRADVDSARVAGSINEARWKTASEIPGLFQIEAPPVQRRARDQRSHVANQQSQISNQQSRSKLPSRNILIESFQIYFRGFFQFLALTLLTLVPSLSGQFIGGMIETAPNVNVDLRTMVAAAFSVCMFVLTLVLWPVYVAGIQILSTELTAGRRVSFLSILNHAVKYWPRVAGLGLFVFVVYVLITGFGLMVLLMTTTAAASGSIFSIVAALSLAAFQIWLFARFFIKVLFWQQFAVLENASAMDAIRLSGRLARSGGDLPWYQRPLWRGAFVVSIWYAFVIAIAVVAYWSKLAAEWPFLRDMFNQLATPQDPQVALQKMMASLPKEQAASLSQIGLSVLQRVLQPLLGIAFVVLYLDSKSDEEDRGD